MLGNEQLQTLKIIVVGENDVGKSSFIKKLCTKKFDEKSYHTIGSDYTYKIIERRHKKLKLQIWDTAGAESFSSVSRMFIRNSQGCIVVSDMTAEQSLVHSVNWKNLIQSHSEYTDQLPILLVQNKKDLIDKSNLKQFQHSEYIKEFSCLQGFSRYYQISTKFDDLDYILDDMVDDMISKKQILLEGSFERDSFNLNSKNFFSQINNDEELKRRQCCQ